MEEQYRPNEKTDRDLIEQNAKDTRCNFWWLVALTGLLIGCILMGVYWTHQTTARASLQEERIKELEIQRIQGSTPFMQKNDVQIMVGEAAKESLNTYINSQNSFIELIGVLITVLVAIIGIAFPLLTNRGIKEGLVKKIREKTEESKKEIGDQMSSELSESKKEISDQMSSELNKSKGEISDELKEGLKQLNDETERQKREINELKDRIEKILKNKQDLAEHAESLKEVNEESDIDKKIAKLEEEIKKNANYPAEGYYDLGLAQSENGEIDDAVSNFMMAVDRKPDYAEAYYALAKALCNKPDYDKAWEFIEKAILLKPEDSEMLMTRCQIYKNKGLVEEAKQDAEHGIELAKKAGNGGLLTDFRRLQAELSGIKDTDETPIDISVGKETFRMVKVKGGVFTMGATLKQRDKAYSVELPAHRVLLDDYYIGETVVPQGLWNAVMGSNPSKWKGDDLPVERVSWEDAQEFIGELNMKTGRTFRLPTEAEWEYAARGGKKSCGYKYSGSNNLDEVAWYGENSNHKTYPVKGKKSNELGLYDMSGNVWEWCQDWYGKYSGDAQSNPQGPLLGVNRVIRGGSFHDIFEEDCRVSYRRDDGTPVRRDYYLGFRLVMCL